MLLRNSVSNTKKFFRRTLQNFKSFFSTGYERLPKSSPSPLIHMNTLHQSHHPELEKLNAHHQWDSEKKNAERRQEMEDEDEEYHESPLLKKEKKMMKQRDNERNMISHQKGRQEDSPVRNYMVERKLRELEMLDMGNVEYVLDIEEVLHYYSRLTCPAYLEIVDNFFMQMYSEFLSPVSSKLPLPNQ
ncbi:uncharacterized protein LOC129293752 [Prosopis cineraria]|uniref:uncharacterized protein LOC129293752 n=1 Tax=Prosopis cineraria TaxID=364024 RepID=UPI0024101359|nr:uncharacterized protein LOC129293752 [Prosopis cineraria]